MNQYLAANLISDLVNGVLLFGGGALFAWLQLRMRKSSTPAVDPDAAIKQLASELRWAVEALEAFDKATAEYIPVRVEGVRELLRAHVTYAVDRLIEADVARVMRQRLGTRAKTPAELAQEAVRAQQRP